MFFVTLTIVTVYKPLIEQLQYTQARSHGGGAFGGSAPPYVFVPPQIVLWPAKFVLSM